jgi:hypothetical protein
MVLGASVALLEPTLNGELFTARVAVITVKSPVYTVELSLSFEGLPAVAL